jgi:Zn-dependent protease with chaperone function
LTAVITALALGGYAVLLVRAAPRLLPRLQFESVPRRGVALLLLLAYSVPLAVLTGGLALGAALVDELARLDPGSDRCADELPFNHVSPVAPLLGAFGFAVAGLLVLRIGFCLLAVCGRAWLRGRAHTAMLRMCGRYDRGIGATVIEHEQAVCYCLPGRRGRIVVTSSAIALLTREQLLAVVAHERAHQRGRHHLLLALTRALRLAVPGVRLIEYAEREVHCLVELIADDAAARRCGRQSVATALAVLGDGHVPGGALGVSGAPDALARIDRLAGPGRRPGSGHAALSVLVVTAALLLPPTLAIGSISMLMRHCPPATRNESQGAAVTRQR